MRDTFIRLGHTLKKRVTTQTFRFQQRTQKESSDPRRANIWPLPSSSSTGPPRRRRPRAAWQCRPRPATAAAPRRGSASLLSSAGPSGSAGHGGARPRPGHGGARPPLSRRLGPRRGSGWGAAVPLGASLGLRRRPARVLGGGAP